ncbi:hypothetical protein JZ751_029083 [Albula glossodonta]|uniref:Uncharacterized protein n=1 Tax=Albula glossodonta TaxID=121402 RepID=A0A8T2PAL9_9TELE|nr:hypothetical protein JZ751_029083 [Albula glossodonta]
MGVTIIPAATVTECGEQFGGSPDWTCCHHVAELHPEGSVPFYAIDLVEFHPPNCTCRDYWKSFQHLQCRSGGRGFRIKPTVSPPSCLRQELRLSAVFMTRPIVRP